MDATLVQPMPPSMSPASRDELLKSFSSEAWLIELAGTVGVHINDIPLDKRQEILSCKTKNWVNMKFFEWFHSKPTESAEFTNEDTALFESLVSLRRSPQYEQAKNNLLSNLSRAKDYFQEAQNYLTRAADSRAKLHELEGTKNINLTEEIKKCIADGWYKYDAELTREHNKANATSDQGIVFTTPTITAKFYNKRAGIELDVNLGQYKVIYMPARNRIVVHKYRDNVEANGHYHPHISDGGVCWGNAEETYRSAMSECQPSRALLALRVILVNYNDESPYTDLFEFAIQRHPELLEGKAEAWEQTVSEWVLTDELPENVTGIREEGEEVTYIRLYHKVYEGTSISVDGHHDNRQYYFKIEDPDTGEVSYEECDQYWFRS